MIRTFFVALACVLTLGASAQTIQSGVAPDPYLLNETQISPQPSRDVSTKTLRVSQSINTGIQNCLFFGAPAQSNWGNVAPTAFTPVNAASIDNLNIYDSAIYNGVDPLVGSSYATTPPPGGGNPLLRVADALVTAGKCARVIIVPIAINGTSIAQWEGVPYASRLAVAIKRVQQRGIVCGGTGVVCVMSVALGETDCSNGVSQAAWVASFNNIVTAANAAGFVGRWLVNKETWTGSASCATIQAAQTSNAPTGVINNGASIFLGANMDALVGNVCSGSLNCRQAGNLHLSDAGSISVATDGTNGLVKALQNSGAPF